MINKYLSRKSNSKFLIYIILINCLFLGFTFNHPWTLDDFGYIHSAKLYNLINGQIISFEPFIFKSNYGFHNELRYLPIFYFLNQLLPTSNILFHSLIVIFHTLTCIIIFFISHKIFKNNKLAFITSMFYAVNYSVSIKSLSWNLFYGHILGALLGFFAILILIKFFESRQSKKILIFFYFLFSSLSFLTTESGLIFPILGFLIIIFFYQKENIILKTTISLSPLLIFIILVFLNTGKILPLLETRANQQHQKSIENTLNPKEESKIYYYRSTYAPRNLEGYLLRGFDNILISLNISSLEKVLKYYDKSDKVKNLIKDNLYFYILLSFLVLVFFIIYIFKEKYSKKNLKLISKSSLMYLLIFLIYTIVFFRKDINLGLAFSSGLLITSLIKNLQVNKSQIKINLIISIVLLPTIFYFMTFFSYWGESWGPKSKMIQNSKYLEKMTKEKIIIKSLEKFSDYKNYYYYYNFKDYKSKLISKYKGLNFAQFQKSLSDQQELLN